MSTKSITDFVAINDKCFPLGKDFFTVEGVLCQVGNCVHCGCPIYGKKLVQEKDPIVIKRTCSCWVRTGVVENKEKT